MKLNALALLICVSGAYAGGDKELAQYAPTVGQALMRVLKKKFSSKHSLQAHLQEKQGKPIRMPNKMLDDAQQLLHSGQLI